MGIRIRMAEHQDFQATEVIENRADKLLIDFLQAKNWPSSTSAGERVNGQSELGVF